jgi:hypothetical protein
MEIAMSPAADPITTAAKQKDLEALALHLSEIPAVRKSREEARQIFLAHPYARTHDGEATLEDAARQHFYGALQLVANNDPYHPQISVVCLYDHATGGQPFPSALHGGLENPDNIYRLIPISSDSHYVLEGVRHDPAPSQVTYELMDSIPGVRGIGEQIAMLMDRDMKIAPDGSFRITIDPDPPGERPNHIRSTPDARVLFIRDTLSDWRTQSADELSISRIAGPQKPRRTERELIEEAVSLVPAYARFWNDFRDRYVRKLDHKTNRFDPPYARTGGWGFIANTHFAIADDEAFVFTTTPEPALYHAVLIGNHWWIALDAARRSGALNTSQARANRDGTITYVVAARDPGAHNWLDTGGLHEGIVQVRWQGTPPNVTSLEKGIVDAKVLKLAALKQDLREETIWVTHAERKAQVGDRYASWQRRLVDRS